MDHFWIYWEMTSECVCIQRLVLAVDTRLMRQSAGAFPAECLLFCILGSTVDTRTGVSLRCLSCCCSHVEIGHFFWSLVSWLSLVQYVSPEEYTIWIFLLMTSGNVPSSSYACIDSGYKFTRQTTVAGFAGDDIYAVFPSLSSGPGCAASCAVSTKRTILQQDSGLSVEPWYLAVTFSACLAGGIQELDFLGDDFDEYLYSAQCLVRQRIHAHASVHGGSGVEVAALAVNTGSGMCSAGLLVRIYLALCSLPRGEAHEAWQRHVKTGFAGGHASRAVFTEMRGRLFGALCIGTGPGVVSTGTRPP